MITVLAMRDAGMDPSGARVAIQGFGKVGGVCAELMSAEGMTVVAVSDSTCGLYRAEGLDLTALRHLKEEGGHFTDYGGAEQIDREQLLTLDVEVLVPAALEAQIGERNADRVRARVIAEGANAPLTTEADEALEARGVLILPDILANAGGVVVSYFEWVQDIQAYFWGSGEVNSRLREVMTRSYQAVRSEAQSNDVTLRNGRISHRGDQGRRSHQGPRNLSVGTHQMWWVGCSEPTRWCDPKAGLPPPSCRISRWSSSWAEASGPGARMGSTRLPWSPVA